MLWIVESKIFEIFIILIIIMNSVFLGLYDYTDLSGDYWGNKLGDKSETIFTVLFTVEATLKIVGYGLIMTEGCYLRDAWNWLDFIVVVTGLISFVPNVGNVSGLRTFRLLRPLRSLSAIPSMRVLVNTLLKSLIQLGNVFFLTTFFVGVFSILGISLWDGMIHYRCR